MTRIMELAEAVAAELGEGAEVALAPEFTLRETNVRRTVVVPAGTAHHVLSRGHRQTDMKVQVGVLQRATEDQLEELVGHVESLAASFLEKTLAGARCLKAEHAPLYVPDHLKERRQFTSVVELTFSEVVRK